jgi:hypothetical protein
MTLSSLRLQHGWSNPGERKHPPDEVNQCHPANALTSLNGSCRQHLLDNPHVFGASTRHLWTFLSSPTFFGIGCWRK